MKARKKDVEISLIQTEIEQAVREYVLDRVTIKEGQTISVDLRATRVPSGFTANISIIPVETVIGQLVAPPVVQVELSEVPIYTPPTLVTTPPIKSVDRDPLNTWIAALDTPVDVPFDLSPTPPWVVVEDAEAEVPEYVPPVDDLPVALVETTAVEIPAEIVEATPEPEPVAPVVPEVVVEAIEVVEVVEPEPTPVVQLPVRTNNLFGNRAARTPAEVRALMQAESDREDAQGETPVEKPVVKSLFQNLRRPTNS